MSDPKLSAIGELFRRNKRDLFSFLRRRVGPDHAADLLQETFVRALRHEGFGGVGNQPAFLQQIAMNLSRDFLRRRKVETAHLEFGDAPTDVASDEASPSNRLEQSEKARLLRQAVESLPPRCREAFVLYVSHRLTLDEIGRRMGISKNMAQKHVRMALQRCAAALD
jgi:RNA polymerase sigma factor (sigma-70 family)